MEDSSSSSSSDGSSELEVPYALDFSCDEKIRNDSDSSDSGICFESPGRQKAREPLRAGDVIAYTSPIFTAGAAHGERRATVIGVDPTQADFPLVLDNCESLPWDTFIQRVGEFYKGQVRPHPGRRKLISSFLLKASKQSNKTLLASVMQNRAAKVKGAMQRLERDAVRAYAGRLPMPSSTKAQRARTLESSMGRSSTTSKESSLGLFPSVTGTKRPPESNHSSTSSDTESSLSTSAGRISISGCALKLTGGGPPASKKPKTSTTTTRTTSTVAASSSSRQRSTSKRLSLSDDSSSSSSSEQDVKGNQSDDSSISVPIFRKQSLPNTLRLATTKARAAGNSRSIPSSKMQEKDSPPLLAKEITSRKVQKKQPSLSDTENEDDEDTMLCTQNIPFYSEYKPPWERQPTKKPTTIAAKTDGGGFLSFSKQNNHSSTPLSKDCSGTPISTSAAKAPPSREIASSMLPRSSTARLPSRKDFGRTKLVSSIQDAKAKSPLEWNTSGGASTLQCDTSLSRKPTHGASLSEDSSSDEEPMISAVLQATRSNAGARTTQAKETSRISLGNDSRRRTSSPPSSRKNHEVHVSVDSTKSSKSVIGADKVRATSNKSGGVWSLLDSDSDSEGNELLSSRLANRISSGQAQHEGYKPHPSASSGTGTVRSLLDENKGKSRPRKSKRTLDEALGLDDDDDDDDGDESMSAPGSRMKVLARRQRRGKGKSYIDLDIYSDDDDGEDTANTGRRSLELVYGQNGTRPTTTSDGKPPTKLGYSRRSSDQSPSGLHPKVTISRVADTTTRNCLPCDNTTLSVDLPASHRHRTTTTVIKQNFQERSMLRYEQLCESESDSDDDDDLELVSSRFTNIASGARKTTQPIQEGKENSQDQKHWSRARNRRGNDYNLSVAPSVLERATPFPKSKQTTLLTKNGNPPLPPSDIASTSKSHLQRGRVGTDSNQKRKRDDILSLSSSDDEDEDDNKILSRRRSRYGKTSRKSGTGRVPPSWSSDCEVDSPPAATPMPSQSAMSVASRHQGSSCGKRSREDVVNDASSPVFDFVDETAPNSNRKRRMVVLKDTAKRKRGRRS